VVRWTCFFLLFTQALVVRMNFLLSAQCFFLGKKMVQKRVDRRPAVFFPPPFRSRFDGVLDLGFFFCSYIFVLVRSTLFLDARRNGFRSAFLIRL
jgi:hypothetical protein